MGHDDHHDDRGHNEGAATPGHFSTETAGLPEAQAPEHAKLGDADVFALRIAPVVRRLGDADVRMLAYNGSIPGPTLRVNEGTDLVVAVSNESDLEATVR
jgi:FtsP/CotA-like multicopper oxidase with cupredoxin domain